MLRAETATSTRHGCCWTKAQRSIGRRSAVDAAVRCLLERATSACSRDCYWIKERRSTKRGATAVRRCTPPARKGHVDAARLLLDKGAEVDRADKRDRTPLYIAKLHGHSPIVALLKEHQK